MRKCGSLAGQDSLGRCLQSFLQRTRVWEHTTASATTRERNVSVCQSSNASPLTQCALCMCVCVLSAPACVKDLIRALRADDSRCEIRRELGRARVLQKVNNILQAGLHAIHTYTLILRIYCLYC